MAPNPPPEPTGVFRLRAAPLAQEIEFLTARTRAIGSAIGNAHLGAHGLKVRSYSVLALAAAGLNPTQRDLAEFLRLDPSQIVSIVDELELAGHVQRAADPGDRRSKVIIATPSGVALYAKASRSAQQAEDIALSRLTAEERSQLRILLRKAAFEDRELAEGDSVHPPGLEPGTH